MVRRVCRAGLRGFLSRSALCSEHELADSGASEKSRNQQQKKEEDQAGWLAWWPLLAGIAITFAAVKTAEILPLMGAGGLLRLQLLYPYALLLKQPQLGLAEQTSNSWSQIMLYAQWVLYGLYVSRGDEVETAVDSADAGTAIHLLGFGVLWLLARNRRRGRLQ